MSKISIIYASGSGHTEKLADFVKKGLIQERGISAYLINVDTITQKDWDILNDSDAIIFGSPTYMGTVSTNFKSFMDKTSSFWTQHLWKDKVAAGFTIGTSSSGDNLNALTTLSIFAAQHAMIWVGQGELGSQYTNDDLDINNNGSWLGLMATASTDKSKLIHDGDARTAHLFGQRIAKSTKRWNQTSDLKRYNIKLALLK